VGGALLTHAFDEHEEQVRDDAYDRGFEDGNNDFGGGGNFDGGDW